MKKLLGILVLGLLLSGNAYANLFNLNTYASCKKFYGPNFSRYFIFSYISCDNNYLRFKYASYSKKFLIEERYSGKTILKTTINDDKIVYKIEFNKETGKLKAKGLETYILQCNKIKKNQLAK